MALFNYFVTISPRFFVIYQSRLFSSVPVTYTLPFRDYNQNESSIRVGFATYDQSIHFYNLNNSDKAEMLISNDLTDVFVPFVEGFFVTLQEAEANIRR